MRTSSMTKKKNINERGDTIIVTQLDFLRLTNLIQTSLGCALLGDKAEDVITFKAPKDEQKVKIEKVIYLPEAHGEDLL